MTRKEREGSRREALSYIARGAAQILGGASSYFLKHSCSNLNNAPFSTAHMETKNLAVWACYVRRAEVIV